MLEEIKAESLSLNLRGSLLSVSGVVGVSDVTVLARCRASRRLGAPLGVGGLEHTDGVADLYTKNGGPLRRSGDKLFARSGTYVGKIKGDYVFDPSRRYAGTIVGERVVYRSTHSARIASPSVSAKRAGSASANRVSSAMWGDEPPFPD